MQLQSEIIPIMCHILVKLLKMFTLTFVYMYVCILCYVSIGACHAHVEVKG